jgi:hypothetical protein
MLRFETFDGMLRFERFDVMLRFETFDGIHVMYFFCYRLGE